MNSKEIYHISTTVLCITSILILIHCTSSQPLSVKPQKVDDTIDKTMDIKPLSNSQLNDIDVDNDDSILKLSLIHSEYKNMNEPIFQEPVRRANFWKRFNFENKRANFWRRNIAS